MNKNIPNHPKLEKARIISSIMSCYSNKNDLVQTLISKEDFLKSLSDGDKFFEKQVITDAIEKARENGESFDDYAKLISKAEVKTVFDGVKKTDVYVLKAEDVAELSKKEGEDEDEDEDEGGEDKKEEGKEKEGKEKEDKGEEKKD